MIEHDAFCFLILVYGALCKATRIHDRIKDAVDFTTTSTMPLPFDIQRNTSASFDADSGDLRWS